MPQPERSSWRRQCSFGAEAAGVPGSARLTLAWSTHTGDLPASRGTFEATPLQVGRLIYLCTPVDPLRRVLIVNPNAMPFRMRLARVGTPAASLGGFWEMPGTGYSVSVYGFLSPLTIPCMQPPWGALFAIDLGSRRILWRRPVGSAVDSGPRGIGSHLPLLIGAPQIGGAIITRGGLVFSAATRSTRNAARRLRFGLGAAWQHLVYNRPTLKNSICHECRKAGLSS
jgi:glucose dehydrogenase